MSKKHDHPTSLLLVEGKNDLHVISSLCNQFNIPECFSIKDCESVEKLEAQIPVQFKASKSILGIICRYRPTSSLGFCQKYITRYRFCST